MRSATLTQSPSAIGAEPMAPNTVSPRCRPAATAAARPYSVFQRSPIGANSRSRSWAAFSAWAVNTLASAPVNTASSESLCTQTARPPLAVMIFPASAKNSPARASTFSGTSASESRVKLRSSV